MFVDELEIYAKAGDGGDGVVRWRHEKYQPKAGPAGGNGGNGGDVYVRAVRDLNQLSKYTGCKGFAAKNGEPGRKKSEYGKGSEDLYIDVPIGATVTDLERDRVYKLTEEGQTARILKGGQGGLGNEHFKSSTNRAPIESTPGKPGEAGRFLIEVALLADVGLVGEPNAGKSTLLGQFTNATSAVGAYPFTTLEPHLGQLYEFVVADIPGLIEGASSGKGLGQKFLRHVTRTSMLLHLVSLEEPDPRATYDTIRKELLAFDAALGAKTEWIILTKADLVSGEAALTAVAEFADLECPVYVVSETDEVSMKTVRDALVQHLRDTVV
jgi:GTP-binding protein